MTPLAGHLLLSDSLLNKGTAFSEQERDEFDLHGLLPPRVATLDEQVSRRLQALRGFSNDLERYAFLRELQDTNETVFYALLTRNIEELLPIAYTPTVGAGCQHFSRLFRKPRGLFLSLQHRKRIKQILSNPQFDRTEVIVVTDGERILGLGDLGSSGMGIPVGKLSLYTACAGIHPAQCLPVMLDVGTNNPTLRDDPLYLGLHRPRLTGAAYDELVEEFVSAAVEAFPGVVVQFEDFANHNAFRLLTKYRDRICTFNDDIQGTAAVALSGLRSALRVTGTPLDRQRVLFLGAGEAATGIADLVVAALVAGGADPAQARRSCWLFDSKGLVVAGRLGELAEHKVPYAHEHAPQGDFVAAIRELEPTAVIGVAATAGAFTQAVVEAMCALNPRPIIFALSNPTSKSECTAEQAYAWSGGKALFACGSPFDPVTIGTQTLVPRQGNNSYIFPGVGLGTIAVRSRRVTDEMFLAAATALAAQVTQKDLDQGSLFPPLSQVREVSTKLAVAVAEVAFSQGHAGIERPADLLAHVRSCMYDPAYPQYV